MGLYAYCVLPATNRPAAGLTGLDDRPVEAVVIEDLAVWVSRLERPQPSVEAAQVHNRVAEAAITEEVTPIPLRFGQWLQDEAALRQAMGEHLPAYREQLKQFAGCLEFGLRLIDPAGAEKAQDVHTSAPTSGLEYMQALREGSRLAEQQRQRGLQVRARVQAALQDVVRAERVQDERTAHAVVTLSHLVARPHFDEYRARSRRLRTDFPELRLLVSGPWPPYSFAA